MLDKKRLHTSLLVLAVVLAMAGALQAAEDADPVTPLTRNVLVAVRPPSTLSDKV